MQPSGDQLVFFSSFKSTIFDPDVPYKFDLFYLLFHKDLLNKVFCLCSIYLHSEPTEIHYGLNKMNFESIKA